jgi:hypothetical protein
MGTKIVDSTPQSNPSTVRFIFKCRSHRGSGPAQFERSGGHESYKGSELIGYRAPMFDESSGRAVTGQHDSTTMPNSKEERRHLGCCVPALSLPRFLENARLAPGSAVREHVVGAKACFVRLPMTQVENPINPRPLYCLSGLVPCRTRIGSHAPIRVVKGKPVLNRFSVLRRHRRSQEQIR